MYKTKISSQTLQDLRVSGLLTPQEAAELCGVHVKTWKRYESGVSQIPWAIYQLLKIIITGCLPDQAGPGWAGWRFINGRLWDPVDNHWHTPGTIRAWFYTAQQLQTFRGYENQAHRLAASRTNVIAFPGGKRAHRLTDEVYRRIEEAEQETT